MEFITEKEWKPAMIHVCDLVVAAEPMLTAMDTIIGDGDHGFGMRDGFRELRTVLMSREYTSLYELLRDSGIELVKNMGGASGVIFGTMFTGGYGVINGKDRIDADDLIEFFDEGSKTIMRRGRSEPGNKTMLDALVPAIEAMRLKRKETADIKEILAAAHEGAVGGMESTKSMIPRLGRSKNFRESAIGHADPGAMSVTIIFKGLSEGIEV